MADEYWRLPYTAQQLEDTATNQVPRISSTTGNWEVWDISTSAWVDTGVSADASETKCNNTNIAPVEPTSTASQAYAVNSFLVYNGQLYRVTAAIAQGDTLTVGTNIAAADVGSYISRISSETAISGITTEAQLESAFDSIIATMSDNTLKFVTLAIGTNFVADIAARHLCRIFRATATYAKVEMSTYSPKGNHVKNKVNGTWEAIEYVNPPLTVNTEYRTTERFLGKPVYVKAIDLGNLPNSTYKVLAHGIANCVPLRVYGFTGAITLPYNYNGAYYTISATSAHIVVTTSNDASSSTATAVFYYTKSTD